MFLWHKFNMNTNIIQRSDYVPITMHIHCTYIFFQYIMLQFQHYYTISPCKHHTITSWHHENMHASHHIAVAPLHVAAYRHTITTCPFRYVSTTRNWLRYIPITTLLHNTHINIIQLHNTHNIVYTWYDDIMRMIQYFHRAALHNNTMHRLHSCIK